LSTSEEIAGVYNSDIKEKNKIVGHSKDGWLHFYDRLKGMNIEYFYPEELIEELLRICATDNINKVGGLPSRKDGRDKRGKAQFERRANFRALPE